MNGIVMVIDAFPHFVKLSGIISGKHLI